LIKKKKKILLNLLDHQSFLEEFLILKLEIYSKTLFTIQKEKTKEEKRETCIITKLF